MHCEHRHTCGRCGIPVDVNQKHCERCGADLMTMAECIKQDMAIPGMPQCDVCWHPLRLNDDGECTVCTMEDTVHDPPYPRHGILRRSY